MKLSTKGQISIPKDVRNNLHLKPGDELDCKIEGSTIVLVPVKTIKIPREQEWFWTEEWQEKEKEAGRDIKAGRVCGPFSSAKEMKKHFKKEKSRLAKN